MQVGLIGVGRCGLPIALNFEQRGLSVIASSYKKDYVDNLLIRKIETTEPHVKELLAKSNIEFTTDNQKVIEQSDVIYIIVATPSLPSGEYDMQAIDDVAQDFKKYKGSLKDKLCIVASTTNPGYCQTLRDSLKEFDLDVAYCPIFIAQGTIYENFNNQDHVMVGTDNDQAFAKAKKFYERIIKEQGQVFRLSFTGAEILKMSLNCFATLKITYANLIGQVLYKSGSWDDSETFYDLLRLNPAIGKKNMGFGFGYGGPCLPRDNISLVKFAKNMGVDYNLGLVVDKHNDDHLNFLFEYHSKQNKENLPYYFSYISYKAGTDLDEPSQQYDLAKLFLKQKSVVYVSPSEFLNSKMINRLKQEFGSLLQIKSLQDLDRQGIKHYRLN